MDEIPRILHQTNHSLTEEVKRSRDSFLFHNPSWDYKFWNNEDCENLVKNDYPYFYPVWSKLKPSIKKWDAIRSIFLHKYGGLYSDVDVLFYKNLNPIIPDNYKLIFRSPIKINKNFDIIKNHFMASRPKLNFWINHLKFIASFKPGKNQVKPDARSDFEMNITSHTGEISLASCISKEFESNSLIEGDVFIIDPSHVINHNFTNSLMPKNFCQSQVYAEHFANNSWL